MSDKFSSMLFILNRIDAGEPVTVQSVMNDLEISQRSVHRYISDLQTGGFPILFDRERGTYRFQEGYHLKQINLTLEETLTLALAKGLLRNAGSGMESGLQAIESKLAKKKTDLPGHILFSAPTFTAQTSRYFEQLNEAITGNRRIEMDYHPLYASEKSRRQVDPQYLFFHDGFWYLRGYCHSVGGERTFGVDRIRALKVLDEYFLPRKKSAEDELARSFGSWVDGDPVEVVVRVGPMLREAVLRKKWSQSQQEKLLDDGSVELTFHVSGLGGIKKWIYGWIPFVEVVSPRELRDQVREELEQTAKAHKESKRT